MDRSLRALMVHRLNPDVLSAGYAQGAFPMADERGRIQWYSVARRALFPIEGVRVSRSLRRTIAKGTFEVRFDTAFEDVMRACFRPDGNWLTEEFVEAYSACHRQGWGHCCETWRAGRLVGGVYGLAVGRSFSAESMFHREPDAGKVALWALVEKCRQLGFWVFDAQVQNPFLESLGAFEVTESRFSALLQGALLAETDWSRGRPV